MKLLSSVVLMSLLLPGPAFATEDNFCARVFADTPGFANFIQKAATSGAIDRHAESIPTTTPSLTRIGDPIYVTNVNGQYEHSEIETYYIGEFRTANGEQGPQRTYHEEHMHLSMSADGKSLFFLTDSEIEQNNIPSQRHPPFILSEASEDSEPELLARAFVFAQDLTTKAASITNHGARVDFGTKAFERPVDAKYNQTFLKLAAQFDMDPKKATSYQDLLTQLRRGRGAFVAFYSEPYDVSFRFKLNDMQRENIFKPASRNSKLTNDQKRIVTYFAFRMLTTQSSDGVRREFILFYDPTSGFVVPIAVDDINPNDALFGVTVDIGPH